MTGNSSRSADAQPNGPQLDTDVTFTYCTVQPNRWTFSAAKIRAWVEQYLDGRVLNACAGPTQLDHSPVHRNDIDPQIDADTHVDVRALPDHLDEVFDVIVYDPPFTSHQAATTYDQSAPGYGHDVLDALDAVLAPGGHVIMFGYSTWGMPAARGYRHEAVGLFNTLGRQHDYLGVVDRHAPTAASDYSAHACPTLTTTVATNAPAPADHAYTEQPEGTVEATYRVADQGDGYLDRPAVREWVDSHLMGRSLVLYGNGASPSHDPLLVNAPPDVAGDGSEEDTTVASTALTDAFSQVFETIVFNPPPTAFQATTEYEGTTTGLSTAIKREVHDVLEPGGRVIQLGHTASCMRADFGYERDAVAVLAVPGDAHDIVGAVDRKRTTDLTALDQTVGVVHKRCRECFAAWTTLDPVFRVPCPTCGATAAHKIGPRLHGGEHCLDLDGTVPNRGTPLEGMHSARIRHAQDHLDAFPPCPVATSGVHERVSDQPVHFCSYPPDEHTP